MIVNPKLQTLRRISILNASVLQSHYQGQSHQEKFQRLQIILSDWKLFKKGQGNVLFSLKLDGPLETTKPHADFLKGKLLRVSLANFSKSKKDLTKCSIPNESAEKVYGQCLKRYAELIWQRKSESFDKSQTLRWSQIKNNILSKTQCCIDSKESQVVFTQWVLQRLRIHDQADWALIKEEASIQEVSVEDNLCQNSESDFVFQFKPKSIVSETFSDDLITEVSKALFCGFTVKEDGKNHAPTVNPAAKKVPQESFQKLQNHIRNLKQADVEQEVAYFRSKLKSHSFEDIESTRWFKKSCLQKHRHVNPTLWFGAALESKFKMVIRPNSGEIREGVCEDSKVFDQWLIHKAQECEEPSCASKAQIVNDVIDLILKDNSELMREVLDLQLLYYGFSIDEARNALESMTAQGEEKRTEVRKLSELDTIFNFLVSLTWKDVSFLVSYQRKTEDTPKKVALRIIDYELKPLKSIPSSYKKDQQFLQNYWMFDLLRRISGKNPKDDT